MLPALRQIASGARRNRGLTAVMVLGLAAGITLWQLSSLTLRQQVPAPPRDPASLFAVALVRQPGVTATLPDQPGIHLLVDTVLAPRDVAALALPALASRIGMTASARLAAAPGQGDPEDVQARFLNRSLFEMFARAFRYGGPFVDGAAEVVLDDRQNREWFGGRDSVGETVRIGGRRFRIAGVLALEPRILTWDTFIQRPEGLLLPMEWLGPLRPWPNPAGPSDDVGRIFRDPASAEDTYVRLWVEVPREAREPYQRALDAYVAANGQRRPAILSARLVPHPEWDAATSRPEGIYAIFRAMGILILAGCALNLVRIAMVLFAAGSLELGIRRAMGESRRQLLRRQLRDAAAVGVLAGAIGLFLLAASVPLFNSLIPWRPVTFLLDARAAMACLAGGPAVAVLAALYPAWRFSRLAPATLLRRQ